MKSWCSATRRRGGWVLGQAVYARAPRRAVLRHRTPLLEVRWQARARQRLVQRVPERELRTPVRARVTNPRGEEPARQPLVAHASDVPRPAQHTQVDVEVDAFYRVYTRCIIAYTRCISRIHDVCSCIHDVLPRIHDVFSCIHDVFCAYTPHTRYWFVRIHRA